MQTGKLTFFCGKMGAGKSTKARELARIKKAVLLSEDDWLESLYPEKICSLADYAMHSSLLKPPIRKLVQSILAAGTDVVLDFPANTTSQRAWFREVYTEVDAKHELVYLDRPDDVCLKQIAKRRIEHPHRVGTDNKEMFDAVTKFFIPPEPKEGFNVIKA